MDQPEPLVLTDLLLRIKKLEDELAKQHNYPAIIKSASPPKTPASPPPLPPPSHADIAAMVGGRESKIKLDVGGKRFITTSTTLCIDPNSMLAAMFSGRYKVH
jgi:hypothetical protein